MKIIEYYSIYALIVSSSCLFAMEEVNLKKITVNTVAEEIIDIIDREYLGITTCTQPAQLKPVLSACVSFYKSYGITAKQAEKTIKRIENDINSKINSDAEETNISKKLILHTLFTNHWYVNYLMSSLINQKIKALESIKGSTIDDVFNYDHSSIAKELVYSKAFNIVFNNSQPFIDIIPKSLCDMHFTILHDPKQTKIQSKSLAMSSDGKYLVAINDRYERLIWDMTTGTIVNPQDTENIDWIHGNKRAPILTPFSRKKEYCVIGNNENYYAVVTRAETQINEDYFSSDNKQNCKGIILFKRPQEQSRLCRMAFYNSLNNQEELINLRESKTIQKIDGFPKDALLRIIHNQILRLTPQKDLKKEL